MLAFFKARIDARGATLGEFSIVLPFLLVLGLGAFEFANALYGRHVISTGLRDAARYLARVHDPSSESNQDKAKQLAVFGEIGGTTKRLGWWSTSEIDVTVTTVANPIDPETGLRRYRGRDPISVVRVSTSTTYPGFAFMRGIGISPQLPINAYHEERSIGD